MTSGTESRPTASSATSAFPRIRTAPAARSNSTTKGCIASPVFVSCKTATACVAFLHLRKRAKHPNLRACSTDRKEVIRCRVISFSRTWPQRIALSGSSLPVKARDARRVTSWVAARGRAMDGNTEGRRLRKKRRPFPFGPSSTSSTPMSRCSGRLSGRPYPIRRRRRPGRSV